jgi:hypothetical protein
LTRIRTKPAKDSRSHEIRCQSTTRLFSFDNADNLLFRPDEFQQAHDEFQNADVTQNDVEENDDAQENDAQKDDDGEKAHDGQENDDVQTHDEKEHVVVGVRRFIPAPWCGDIFCRLLEPGKITWT